MSDSDAFKEWFESKLKDARETNDKDFHASLSRYVGFYQYGFEAAWQHQQKRIDELEELLTILKPHALCDKSCLLSCKMEADAFENEQERANLLEAQLAIAVDALDSLDGYEHCMASGRFIVSEAIAKIRKIGE